MGIGMRRISYSILIILTLSYSTGSVAAIFSYDNYYECILGEMPKAKNDLVARQIMGSCAEKAPETNVEKRSGWVGVKSVQTCLDKYLNKTSSSLGAMRIRYACNGLYVND